MEAQNDKQVHYFDTRTHQILCGLRGIEHRSTKHARAVTCQACVDRLASRAARGDAGLAAESAGTAGH